MVCTKLLLCLLLLIAFLTKPTSQQKFKCSGDRTTCQSLVGYKPPNATTISDLKTFFGVKHLGSLLGANNLPLNTTPDYTIEAQQLIKIPIPCMCYNQTGVSNKVPIYTVKPDDGLYLIATTVFSSLLKYPQIVDVNGIKNPNLIEVRQKLWIPLPCSCDQVDGEMVVHYAHVVEEGSTVEQIADMFGTTNVTLFELNGIANDSELIAGNVLDVPLKACNTSILSKSPDYPLLVANNTYSFTANNCVKCKCDSANNWKLQCEPSGLNASNNWSSCPSMQCEGSDNLYIGNTTTSGCNTCAYAGFSSNRTIFTTLVTESICSEPGGFSSSIDSSWSFLLISFNLILLYIHLY